MLHLALAALLAGSLATPTPDGPTGGEEDKNKQKMVLRTEAPVGVADEDDAIVNDTYSFGRSEDTPIKIWVAYAYGETEDIFCANGSEFSESPCENTANAIADGINDEFEGAGVPFRVDGDDVEAAIGDGGFGEVSTQRALVGAQINALNLRNFKIGVGAQLVFAQDRLTNLLSPEDFEVTPDVATGAVDITRVNRTGDSDFSLQNLKLFGQIRGRTLGLHGGYILDLGAEVDEDAGEVAVSDQRDAVFFGADFDYPAEWIRLFGGIDYFNLLDDSDTPASEQDIKSNLIVFNAGAGVNISWVELGAAVILRTNINDNRFGTFGGAHHGAVAPYLRLSPPFLPVAVSVKGAVLGEYADYGFSMGGANDFVTNRGFTVSASLGF